MTSFADFRAHLNAHPEHTDTLLILADFCDEHGEPYGEGYRALGLLSKWPRWFSYSRNWGWVDPDWFSHDAEADRAILEDDWLRKIEICRNTARTAGVVHTPARKADKIGPFVLFKAAAKAFCALPPARRAELLAQAQEVGK